MSDGSGRVTLTWGGQEREFRLAHRHLRELQDVTKAGPEELYFRIGMSKWTIADLRETLRIALIGGGASRDDAANLMRDHFDDTPLMPHKEAALRVLKETLIQPEDDPLGKAPARETG